MRIQLGLNIEGLIVGRVKTFDSNDWWKNYTRYSRKMKQEKRLLNPATKSLITSMLGIIKWNVNGSLNRFKSIFHNFTSFID